MDVWIESRVFHDPDVWRILRIRTRDVRVGRVFRRPVQLSLRLHFPDGVPVSDQDLRVGNLRRLSADEPGVRAARREVRRERELRRVRGPFGLQAVRDHRRLRGVDVRLQPRLLRRPDVGRIVLVRTRDVRLGSVHYPSVRVALRLQLPDGVAVPGLRVFSSRKMHRRPSDRTVVRPEQRAVRLERELRRMRNLDGLLVSDGVPVPELHVRLWDLQDRTAFREQLRERWFVRCAR